MPSLARTLSCAVLPCAIALSVPALAAPGDNEKTSRVAVDDAVTKVVTDIDTGAVTIRTGKTGSVDVTKRWQGTEPSLEVKVSKGVLTVTGRCPGLINGPVVYAGSPLSVCETSVVITLPAGRLDTSVSTRGAVSLTGRAGNHDLASGTGPITVSSTSGGALHADTNGGSVSLRDVSADTVDVTSSTGAVTLERVSTRGATTIDSNGGDVRLSHVLARSFDVDSSTGDVSLDALKAVTSVAVDSNGGRVTATGVRASRAMVSSSTGDVSLVDLVVASPLALDSNGGDVSVRSSRAPSLDVASSTGDVVLRDVTTAKVTVDTNGGNIVTTGTPAAFFDLSSSTGSVDVTTAVPPVSTKVDTNGGDVTVTVPRGAYGLVVSQNGGRLTIDGISLDKRSGHSLDLTSGTADITVLGR